MSVGSASSVTVGKAASISNEALPASAPTTPASRLCVRGDSEAAAVASLPGSGGALLTARTAESATAARENAIERARWIKR